jgi:hypothetical protein
MWKSLISFLPQCIGFGIVFAVFVWWERGGQEICVMMLTRWLKRENLELVNWERRWFGRGPFAWSSHSQRVFRITVRDSSGVFRQGWARCGGMFLAEFADKVTFVWDAP